MNDSIMKEKIIQTLRDSIEALEYVSYLDIENQIKIFSEGNVNEDYFSHLKLVEEAADESLNDDLIPDSMDSYPGFLIRHFEQIEYIGNELMTKWFDEVNFKKNPRLIEEFIPKVKKRGKAEDNIEISDEELNELENEDNSDLGDLADSL